MQPISFSPSQAPAVRVTAALAPARNALVGLWALTAGEETSRSAWLAQQAERLTPAQERFNRLLFSTYAAALLPDDDTLDFPAHLARLAAQPETLQARLAMVFPTPAAAAPSPQAVLDHLRMLWEGTLAAEWQRQATQLAQLTRSIDELIFDEARGQAMSAPAALRLLLQTELTDAQLLQLAGVEKIVLVWSPFVRAYCNRFGSPDTLWVFRPFEPQLLRRDPLRRAEVLRPLEAVADDTRLRILELLTAEGELRAQEIIAQLEGSQGNISRHLKQLVGAGFLGERRAGDANKRYAVDPAGLPRLLFLLRQLLSHQNATSAGQELRHERQLNQVRTGVPPALHDLVDAQGRITRWPAKVKDQQAMIEYLVVKFEPEQSYSEKAVNDLLRQWYLDADYVLVRRSLVDAGLLRRTRDGTRYWREVTGDR